MWRAEFVGRLFESRCSYGIIELELYRTVSEKVSKREGMWFMKLNGNISSKFMVSVAVFFLVVHVEAAVVQTKNPQFVRADSRPRLLQKIELGDYGSKYARIGDLDGDGVVDFLFAQTRFPEAQEERQEISCLTAINRNGKILWQRGKPDLKNLYFTCDFPLQIHDWNRDGINEVVYMPDEKNVLTVLDGKTGKLMQEKKLEGGHDSLLFADFSGNGFAQDILIKDRYRNFWVYDKNLSLLWSKQNCNTGHYPMEYDFNGDGKDELLCGYNLYGHDGKILWNKNKDLPEHNDAIYIDDMDADGQAEIAIATSVDAVLLDADGKILFRQPMNHCQHALIGNFRPNLEGKQVWFIDRLTNQTIGDKLSLSEDGPVNDSSGWLFKNGKKCNPAGISLYSKAGEKLVSDKTNIWATAGVVIDHWVRNPKEDFLGLYSRGFDPPGIWDGHGREIATFPFPEAIVGKGAAPGGRDLYDDYYLQHVDCYGDEREEIICYNHKAVYIWTNSAPTNLPDATAGWKPTLKKQPARLYNTNFYPGRL